MASNRVSVLAEYPTGSRDSFRQVISGSSIVPSLQRFPVRQIT
ncbi:hypothetical protein [Methanosarcina sp. DH2]|nr:hypothetical protein [Methanosarcina sp. DH2]